MPSVPVDILCFIFLVILTISFSLVGNINQDLTLLADKKDVKCVSVFPTFAEIVFPNSLKYVLKLSAIFFSSNIFWSFFITYEGKTLEVFLPNN